MIATKYWSSLKGEIACTIRENNNGGVVVMYSFSESR